MNTKTEVVNIDGEKYIETTFTIYLQEAWWQPNYFLGTGSEYQKTNNLTEEF